jgi:hypothetical protein
VLNIVFPRINFTVYNDYTNENILRAALLKPGGQLYMGHISLFRSWLLKHFNPKETFGVGTTWFSSLLLALAYNVAALVFVMNITQTVKCFV